VDLGLDAFVLGLARRRHPPADEASPLSFGPAAVPARPGCGSGGLHGPSKIL
jgi:hypothetical protein